MKIKVNNELLHDALEAIKASEHDCRDRNDRTSADYLLELRWKLERVIEITCPCDQCAALREKEGKK